MNSQLILWTMMWPLHLKYSPTNGLEIEFYPNLVVALVGMVFVVAMVFMVAAF